MNGSLRWSMAFDRVAQFWGRSALTAQLTTALNGSGSNVVLVGPGGVGKTALGVRTLVQLAESQPALRAVHFAATTATSQTPLAVFVPVLRDYERLSSQSPDRVAQALVKACLAHVAASSSGRTPAAAQLVIMIDDVPLLDNMSALVLDYLLSRTDVRVLLTCRTLPGLSPSLIRSWRDGNLERCEVPNLDRDEIAEIAGEILAPSLPPGTTLAPDALTRMADVTGGNALFLIELLRSLERSNSLELRQGLWVWRQPFSENTSLADIVRAELAHLSPDKRAAFETIALCAPVSVVLLSTHIELDTINALAEDGLIGFHAANEFAPNALVTVAQPMHGEVMSALLNPIQRMARLGAMYDAALGLAPHGGENSELLALVSWGLRGGRDVPLDIMLRAFDLAQPLADYAYRIVLASALLQHREADDALGLRALTDRIEAQRFSNDPQGVLHDAGLGRTLVERMPASAARTELLVDFALVLADAYVLPQTNWRDGLRTLHWAEEKLDESEASPLSERGRQRIAIARGIYLSYAGKMAEAVKLQHELYEKLHTSADFLPLASTLVIALAQRGESKRSRAVARQQMALAVRSAKRHPLAVGDMVGAWCLADMFTGNVREASVIYSLLNAAIERNPGHVRVRSTLIAFGRGLLAITQGEWETAVTNLKVACSELDDFTGTGSEGLLLSSLTLAQAATGDKEGSEQSKQLYLAREDHTSRLLELPARYNVFLASLYFPTGEELYKARALVALAQEREFALMELRALHGVALCSAGAGAGVGEFSLIDLKRVRALSAQIDSPLATALLHSCEHIMGGGARSSGSAARALARRGLLIPSGQAFAELTSREQQLAELLSLGFSNNQIAKRLTISKRTVESHAAKVLQKLQVTSRDDVEQALETRSRA